MGLSREQILKKLEKLKKQKEEVLEVSKRVVEEDPFWAWEPNSGVITEEKREVLGRWLKEEDIPDKTDGQLDVLLSEAEIKGISGGNRSAKTDVATVRGVINSVGELPESLEPYRESFRHEIDRAKGSEMVQGRVTGVDNKQLHRVVIPMWMKYVPKKFLRKGDWDTSYSKEFDILSLYSPTNQKKKIATVEFLTNEQKVKSAQGNVLHWASFDEEPEQAKYKETLMRFGTADKLDIMIAWTPTEGLTWATDLFEFDVIDDEEDDSDKNLFKLTPVTNPYVNTETLIKIMDEYAKVSPYEEMKMRLLGEAISLTGLIYSGFFRRADHVIEPFEVTYKDFIVNRGLDPHLAKPTACVELATDVEGNHYVIGTYMSRSGADTNEIKADLADRAKSYRLGRTICDVSADYDIKIAGGVNVFKEFQRGLNKVPALVTSEKYKGSIISGVNEIKKNLKIGDSGHPKLFIFDIPENQILIKAMQTLEREAYANEDKKGIKDTISEGKHDAHACLRYIHQMRLNWIPVETYKPEVPMEESYV